MMPPSGMREETNALQCTACNRNTICNGSLVCLLMLKSCDIRQKCCFPLKGEQEFMSSRDVEISSRVARVERKDRNIEARHKLLFPSQWETTFLPYTTTLQRKQTNQTAITGRVSRNCSTLQCIIFLPHTRGWRHTECLRDSMLDVIVCLEHRHWTLGFLCVCVCSCYSCYSTDDNQYLVKMEEPGMPAFSPVAPVPR